MSGFLKRGPSSPLTCRSLLILTRQKLTVSCQVHPYEPFVADFICRLPNLKHGLLECDAAIWSVFFHSTLSVGEHKIIEIELYG